MTTERRDHEKADHLSGGSGTTSEPSHSGPQAGLGGLFERKVAQRKAARGGNDGGPAAAPAASGSGSPMPDGVRGKMEGAFGQDFSDVRVHAGSQHAPALGAQAYTQGSDIHFAPGQYDTSSRGGQELIGHELTHVVQQRAGRVSTPQGKDGIVNADAGLEAEADTLGARAARGESVKVSGSSAGLQRKASGPIQLKKATTLDGMAKEMAEALDDPLISSRFSELADYLCDKQWQAFTPQLQTAYRTVAKKPTWDVANLRAEIEAKYPAKYKKEYLVDLFDNGCSSPLQQIYLGLGLVTGSPSAASFTGFFGIRQASERETVALVERHYEAVKGGWAALDPLLKDRLGPVHYERLVKYKAMKEGDAATLAHAQQHAAHGHPAPATPEKALEHQVEHAQDELNTHLTAGPQAASGLTAGAHTNEQLLGGVDKLHTDLDTKAATQTTKDADAAALGTKIGAPGVKGSLTQKFDAQNTKRTALVTDKAQKQTALGQVGVTPGLAETAHQARLKADADRQLAQSAEAMVTQLKTAKATKAAIDNAKAAAKRAKTAASGAEKSAVEAERAKTAIEEQIAQLGRQLTATDLPTSDYSKAKSTLDKATADKAIADGHAAAARQDADAARTAATDADTKLKAIRDLVGPRIGYLASVIASYKTKTLNPELVEDIRGWCEQNEETGAREWAIIDPKSAFLVAIQPFKPRDQQYLKALLRGEDAEVKAALHHGSLTPQHEKAVPDVMAARASMKREQQKQSEKTVHVGVHHRKLKAQLNELSKDARDVYLIEMWNEAEAAKARAPGPPYTAQWLDVAGVQEPAKRMKVVDGPFQQELTAGGVSGKDLEDIKAKFMTLQDTAGSSYVRLRRHVMTEGPTGWSKPAFGDKALLLISHLRPEEYLQVRADPETMKALATCYKAAPIGAILGVDLSSQQAAQAATVDSTHAREAGAVGHYKDEAELNPKHWSTLLDVEIGRHEYFATEENRRNLNHVVLLAHGAQMAAYRDAARAHGEQAVDKKDKENHDDPVAKAFMLAVYLGLNDKSRASLKTHAPGASDAMQHGAPITVDMVLAAVTRHHFMGKENWHAIWVRKQDLIQSFEQCNGSELLHEWSNFRDFGTGLKAIQDGASTTKDKDKKAFARGFVLDVRDDRREFIKKTLGSEQAAIDVCNQLRTKLKLAMEHDHLFKDAFGQQHDSGGAQYGLENNEFSRDRVELNGLVEAADLRENSWQMQHFSAKGALLQGQKRNLRHNVTTVNNDISTQLDLHDQSVASGHAAPGVTSQTVADQAYAPKKEELGKDKEAVSRSMEAFDTLREKVKKYTEIALAILLTIAVTASTLGAGGLPAAALLGVKIAAAAAVKLSKRFVEHILSNDTAQVSQILFELVGDMAGVALTGAVAYASTAATAAAQLGPMGNFKDNPFAKEAFKAFVKESMLIPVNELKQRGTARTQVDTPVGKWIVDKLKAYAVEFGAAELTATYSHYTEKEEAGGDDKGGDKGGDGDKTATGGADSHTVGATDSHASSTGDSHTTDSGATAGDAPPTPTVASLMDKQSDPHELIVDATAEEIGDSTVEATEHEEEGERAKRTHVGHSTKVGSWNYLRYELHLADSSKAASDKPWDQWQKERYPGPSQWLATHSKLASPRDPKGYAQLYAPAKGGFLLPGNDAMTPELVAALTPAAAAPCDPKVTAAIDRAYVALGAFQTGDLSVKLSDVRNALIDIDTKLAALPEPWTKKLPDQAKVQRLKDRLVQLKPLLENATNKSADVTGPADKTLGEALAKYDIAVADTATLVRT